MEEPKYAVFLFASVSFALKAEKILKAEGIAHKLIPVPRHISSDCGVCLRVDVERQEAVTAAMNGKVIWETVAPL